MIFSMRNLDNNNYKSNYKEYYKNYTANKDSVKKDKYLPLRIAIIALLPVLVCLLYALIDGHLPFKNSLQYSTWNDELFYFKQTEGILSQGIPKGFFGFNESHAKVLSFAAWSPTLILPWLALGKIFGWKLFSPFIYNALLYCGAMLFWGIKTKPDFKKLLLVSAAFLLFPLNYRYIFSAMPEIIVWALIIVFYTLALVYTDARPGKGKTVSLVTMFFLSVLLTTMRPYFILLMLLPSFFLFLSYKGKKKWLAVFIDLAAAAAATLTYFLLNRYLASPYFTALDDTRWISKFRDEGIIPGLKFFCDRLYTKSVEVFFRINIAFKHGYQSDGAIYFVYIIIIAVLLISLLVKVITRNKKYSLTLLHLMLSMIVLLIAIEVMYKPYEGSKHLLAFIIPAILVFIYVEDITYIRTFIVCVSFILMFIAKRPEQKDYLLPYNDGTRDTEIAYWKETFKEIELKESKDAIYENTLIWNYGEGEDIWQYLYSAPAGMGINCCTDDYLIENFNSLQSGYIAAPAGGEIETLLENSPKWQKIGSSETIVLYAKVY
ncbi:MAG: hypothetical protein IJ195_05660 [Lachnospiraceae bacterium]|nr:hypothetical protein [Lachnospiraceae bacterium]